MRVVAKRFTHGTMAILFAATQLLGISLMTQKAFASGEPLLAIITHPDVVSNVTTPTFGFSTTQEAEINCSIDGAPFATCTDPYTTAPLSDGDHTLSAFAVSLVTGIGPTASFAWTVDTVPPDTFITALGTDVTVNTSSDFIFTSAEAATFECKIDAGEYASCPALYTTPNLTPGNHTLSARAVDAAGNVDSTSATKEWTINTIDTGDGTMEHPYLISDCEGWLGMQNDLGAYYTLANNIDCTGVTMTPIGDGDNPFYGNLNGNGYTISNVDMINTGFLGTGLFGATSGATISALRITDSSIVEGEANGDYNLGSLVGTATDTIISNITSSNLSISTADSSTNNFGGLVGVLDGTSVLENSYFDGTITNGSSSQNGTGGLVGLTLSTSEVRDSYATGLIEATNYIGGLVGYMDDSSVLRKSYSDITIDSGGEVIGGLVGYVGSTTNLITRSFSVSNMLVVLHDSSVGALIGINRGSLANNYFVTYSEADPSALPCVATNYGTVTNCTGVSSADYFKGNSTNQPMSSFDAVWNLHDEGQLPTFAIGQVVCDDPATQSESTLLFGCDWGRAQVHHYSGNAVSQQIRYRLRNSSDPWKYQDWSTNSMKILITGLQAGTDYEVQFHANWEIGSSDWTSATAWLSTGSNASLDTDGDGIKDSIEINGPNLGDANGDQSGIDYSNGDDFKQANVTSLVNPLTGKYAVLQSNCTNQSAVSVMPESTTSADTGYNYNSGLISFTATGCASSATFTQYFYGTYDASKFIARKYNSATKTYTTIPGAVLSNVTINGQAALKIVYQVADNGPLDENSTVGTITDPSGPATLVVSVPNTGIQKGK